MSTDNKNLSAFPIIASNGNDVREIEVKETGITKREYFAAMVMQGFMSSRPFGNYAYEEYAAEAVKYADAILAELEKQSQ